MYKDIFYTEYRDKKYYIRVWKKGLGWAKSFTTFINLLSRCTLRLKLTRDTRYTSTRAFKFASTRTSAYIYTSACRSKNGGDCQIDILNGFNRAGIIRMLAPSPRVELAEQIWIEEGSVLALSTYYTRCHPLPLWYVQRTSVLNIEQCV